MNKSVIISIQPKWCELIASGKKTIEVRKTRPKIDTPFKCYIYCTKDRKIVLDSDNHYNFFLDKNHGGEHYFNGKVIGEFVCDRIYSFILCSTDGGSAERERQYYLIGEDSKIIEKFWIGSCIEPEELAQYIKEEDSCYGWHISRLKIYDKPKELGEFRKPCYYKSAFCLDEKCEYWGYSGCENFLTRPFQSWGYVEE